MSRRTGHCLTLLRGRGESIDLAMPVLLDWGPSDYKVERRASARSDQGCKAYVGCNLHTTGRVVKGGDFFVPRSHRFANHGPPWVSLLCLEGSVWSS